MAARLSLVGNQSTECAAMYARGIPPKEIARQLDIPVSRVTRFIASKEGQETLKDVKTNVIEATKTLAVADKVRRVILAQEMVSGILAVIKSRKDHAPAPNSANAMPGEETGHVVVKETQSAIGNARFLQMKEARFDSSLHNELRRWLEYVATELGDLDKGIKVTHTGTVTHSHLNYDYSALSTGELEKLAELAEKIKIEDR